MQGQERVIRGCKGLASRLVLPQTPIERPAPTWRPGREPREPRGEADRKGSGRRLFVRFSPVLSFPDPLHMSFLIVFKVIEGLSSILYLPMAWCSCSFCLFTPPPLVCFFFWLGTAPHFDGGNNNTVATRERPEGQTATSVKTHDRYISPALHGPNVRKIIIRGHFPLAHTQRRSTQEQGSAHTAFVCPWPRVVTITGRGGTIPYRHSSTTAVKH